MKQDKKLNIRSLLRNRNYVRYWFASAIADAASNILQFVLALYVLDITGSAGQFAVILSIVVVPRLVLMPVSGLAGDRLPRMKLMMALTLINAIFLAIFFLLGQNQSLSIAAVYVLVIGLEITEVFYAGPSSAIIPDIVTPEEINEATSLSKVDDGIVWVTSPMLGALIYANLGVVPAIGVTAIMYLIASILQKTIRTPYALPAPEKKEKTNFFVEITGGIRYILGDRFLTGFILILPVFNAFFSATFSVAVAYLLREAFELSVEAYGLFNTLTTTVSLFVPFIAVPLVKRVPFKKLYWRHSAIIAITIIIIALFAFLGLNNYIGVITSVIIIGILDAITIIAAIPMQMTCSVFFRTQTPKHLLSRVMMVVSLVSSIGIAGGKIAVGFLVDNMGIYRAIAVSGMLLLICALSAKWLYDKAHCASAQNETLSAQE